MKRYIFITFKVNTYVDYSFHSTHVFFSYDKLLHLQIYLRLIYIKHEQINPIAQVIPHYPIFYSRLES